MIKPTESKEGIELICFWVGGKLFALEMNQVIEIMVISRIYPLPKAKSYAEGVIYYRDKIIPLINLRKRLGLSDFTSLDKAVTLLVNIQDETLGILVDQVLKMVMAERTKIKAAPPRAFGLKGEYLWGTWELESKPVLWLKLHQLINQPEKIVLSP